MPLIVTPVTATGTPIAATSTPATVSGGQTFIQGISMSHMAIFISILMFAVLIPALFAPKKFKAAVEEFLDMGNAMIRFSSVFLFLVAFFVINSHWSVRVWSNRSILSVFGYLLVIKGLCHLWFPEFVRRSTKKFLNSPEAIFLISILGLLVAAGIGYLGFWTYTVL